MARGNQAPSDLKGSALWGTGNRGGEHRSSALWGRGGRGAVTALVATFVLLAPIAAFAGGNNSGKAGGPGKKTYVSPGLLDKARANGNQKLHVIIQSAGGAADANGKINGLGAKLRKQLNLIGAIAVDLPAGKLAQLAQQPGLTITPDAPVHNSGMSFSSAQMWPYQSGVAHLWGTTTSPAPNAPTIAIVDSGLQDGRADFGSRAYPEVNLSSLTPSASGDDFGHGTFVAGIAAGSSAGYAGAAPTARILPVRVMDGNGVALTSDVIAAAQWILANKDAYNIRVANFSLHSGTRDHFYNDPLDQAVEKLWFGGVTVVTAAGNYGTGSTPSRVMYSPGNDPFVITVGASDINNTVSTLDDTAAPWSAWGYTEDGFSKPELGAPGRYMVGPVPASSTLVAQRPDHVVADGYMQLSGTSFAAPAVAGAAASLLALHPDWTPDQVKGALMLSASAAPAAVPHSLGVGVLDAGRAAALSNPPNPNKALDGFVVNDPVNGQTFDATVWNGAVAADASWADASWADASWADASWADASWAGRSAPRPRRRTPWADASWADASWADASWADASWADASWADASWADNAPAAGVGGLYPMTEQAFADIQANPWLALPLDPVTTTTSTATATTTSTTNTTLPPAPTPLP